MVYLDYSATTPINKEVLDSFNKVNLEYIGNANSSHKLGIDSKNLINQATKQILDLLKLNNNEVIYTSGSTESNNLALIGTATRYKKYGNHIITTNYEHSSIYAPLSYLADNGFVVDFVNCDEHGRVDISHLKDLITDKTILVSVTSVCTETGIMQNIDEIAGVIKSLPNTFLHVDCTGSMGKFNINYSKADLISFSAHKFYGIKGIGCLIKKKDLMLNPIIYGGKSTTKYRSGTPATALIVSLSKALRLIMQNVDQNYEYVKDLNDYLKSGLSKYDRVVINSNKYSMPHIFNISVLETKPETIMRSLEIDDIYISSLSACSSGETTSKKILKLTSSMERATSSLRISLSYLTTKEELDSFLNSFDKIYGKLVTK